MLSNTPISELIKLRQDYYDEYAEEEVEVEVEEGSGCDYTLCDLFEGFDSQPEDAGDEENNKLMGLIGLILLSLGLSGGVSSGFFGGSGYGIGSYISWGLSLLGYIANIWGWWKYIVSTGDEPTEWAAFTSWRWNWLAALVIAVINLWNFASAFIWWMNWPTVWGAAGGSLVIGGVGAYFVYAYIQNYWWNIDEDGSMADNEDWNWFAEDPDEGSILEELDEAADDATDYYY